MAGSRFPALLPVMTMACLLLAACATSPTGRSQLMMVDDSQMAASGQQMFARLQQQATVIRDVRVNNRVQCVVNTLLRELPESTGSNWEVRVFADKTPNAFALPGRKIGVNSGMLDLVQNDAQLAAVIGHEVGHVLARHASERASMGLLAQMSRELAGQVVSPSAATVFGLGTEVGVLLPYSRTHEAEADVMGQDMMARAGYDPRESITLWQRMAGQSQGNPPEFLSTHPANATRLQGLGRHLQTSWPLYQQARAAGKVPACLH